MSFGYSAGDFIAIGQLTWTVYKSCKGAPGEFQELARELSSLHTILHELEDEAKTSTSLLNRRGVGRKRELEALLENLSTTINKVDDIVKRYHSLGRDQKQTWDRVKFATKDLADLRSKLQLHITGINLFISSLSAGSLARIEGLLNELVRDIREGRKEPTLVSTCEDNDEPAWDELERELVGDGITREDVRCYREEIREYLRRLVGEDTDTINPFDSVSFDEEPGHSTPNYDKPASHQGSSTVPDEEWAVWHSATMDNEDPGYSTSDVQETAPRTVPVEKSSSAPYHPSVTMYQMIVDRLANPLPVKLFELTTRERQTIVLIATTPKEELAGLGLPYLIPLIPNPSSSTSSIIKRTQKLASELAFSRQTFDYQAYGKLGSALCKGEIGLERLSYMSCLWFNLFGAAIQIKKSDLPNIPRRIVDVLQYLKHEYIEIPGGYRCRSPGYPRTEFFILIRIVQLCDYYGILFCNLALKPFSRSVTDRFRGIMKEQKKMKRLDSG